MLYKFWAMTHRLLRTYAVGVSVAFVALVVWLIWHGAQERQRERLWQAQVKHAEEARRYDQNRLRREAAEVERLSQALAQARSVLAQTADGTNPFEDAVGTWLDQVNRLSTYLGQHPEYSIPELRYLTANDWLDATKGVALVTEADFRKALATLRRDAKQIAAPKIRGALKLYLAANNDTLPPDTAALTAYLPAGTDPAILQRYRVNPSGKLPGLRGDQPLVLVESGEVDPLWDSKFFFSNHGESGYYGTTVVTSETIVADAISRFRQSNGSPPTDVSQITPYLQRTVNAPILNAVFSALTSKPSLPPGGGGK